MTERALRRFALVTLLAGLALVVGGILSGLPGVAGTLLAQPLLALGLSTWQGRRTSATWRGLGGDLAALLGVWLLVPALLAGLTFWPLSALRTDGQLADALILSAAVATVAMLLWRFWPAVVTLERSGGSLPVLRRALRDTEWQQWRGLGAAGLLFALGALVWLPALLPGQSLGIEQQAGMAAGAGLVSLLLHLGLVGPARANRPRGDSAAASAPVSGQERPMAEQLLAEAARPVPPLEPLVPSQWVPELYEAARGGKVDRALQLIEAGADVTALPPPDARDQRPLAVLAALLPDLRLLRALIAAGVDLNQPHRGMTALLAATRDSWHGRPEAVMMLVANGADPTALDNAGNTPLHFAARSADPGVAAQLRDAGAVLDVVNADGLTPLGIACQCGNWRLARFLLERGARCEVEHAVPALLAAAGSDDDDPAGVQLLLRHKARVTARDAQRRTALHEAAAAGHVAVVEVLLAAGASLEARDLAGRTPLLEACANGHVAVLESLLAHRPDLHALDAQGRNAVWLAAAADQEVEPLVRMLLAHGVGSQVADQQGRLPAEVAAAAGRWSVVALLDPQQRLPAAVENLRQAREGTADAAAGSVPDRAPLAILRETLGRGSTTAMLDMLRLCSAEELGQLLHDPLIQRQPACLAWLLAHGADQNAADAEGHTVAYRLLTAGRAGMPALEVLLEREVSLAGPSGLARLLETALASAPADRLEEAFVLGLFEHGLDTVGPGQDEQAPLLLAIRLGWLDLAERLLRDGADPEARDPQQCTALHLATQAGNEAAVRLLVRLGADPQARALDGQTPLGLALVLGRPALADWLDWRTWPLPLRPFEPADLPSAAALGDSAAVGRLLDLGLDIESVDAQGCTALLRAAGGGHLELVHDLLARGADPCHAARSGVIPLSAAVTMRQGDIVKALLDAGADIEQRLPGRVSVLMLAATLGMPDIVAILIQGGADVRAVDAKQLTALHCAAQFGYTARDPRRLQSLLGHLVAAGSDVNARAAMGLTPLLLLLGAGADPGTPCEVPVVVAAIEQLLAAGAELDDRDARGFGPLHLAALHGQAVLIQRLLRAGADPEVRDTLGRTPREIAVMRGYIDIAAEFSPHGPGVTPLSSRFQRLDP